MSLVKFRSSNHPQQVAVRGATERDALGTDPAMFAELDARFHFTLDVAASIENTKCERFYDREADGLEQSWNGERVWCNPPYSECGPWVDKAWDEWWGPSGARLGANPGAELIVMLLPANRTEQRWWQDLVEPYRDNHSQFHVEFLRGRRRFVRPGQESIGPNERPPFGCCLLIWSDQPTKGSK